VSSDFHHDLLKLGWSDEPIVVGIKVSECLSNSFSPEPFEELGEFLETDNMVTASFTQVQLDPIAIIVER
jgi:hypothetical protein